ncbi:MAG: hypothetical protein ACYTGZ_02480 [Planctomycetota bacterium]
MTLVALGPIPAGYAAIPSASQKIILKVDVLLSVAEAANDLIDITGTLYADEVGSAIGSNSAAIASAPLDIGVGTAQYAVHTLTRTLTPGDFRGCTVLSVSSAPSKGRASSC